MKCNSEYVLLIFILDKIEKLIEDFEIQNFGKDLFNLRLEGGCGFLVCYLFFENNYLCVL